jgi:putative ABC transport system permease protein
MSAWRYILASLRQYRRVHLAVAAGVAVATAVITGALLVGDSMRGSLRDLALRGLGRIDSVVLGQHPFRAALAQELFAAPAVKQHFAEVLPLLLTQGAATRQDGGEVHRATGLNVVGVTPQFWSLALDNGSPSPPVSRGNEVALTASVAHELGATVGDFVVLRIPLAGATPADSALGEKEETTASRRLKVTAILDENAAHTMARFTLRPTQQAPRNAFVPLATLQSLLELSDLANALALAANDPQAARTDDALRAVEDALHPELADYGLAVEEGSPADEGPAAYVRIAADRLVIPSHVVETVERLFGNAGVQPVVTYLANTIVAGDRKIPYSTVAGVDSTTTLGPVVDAEGAPVELADNEVALNDWAAEDLRVAVGDDVTLTYYEPETTHGELREHEPLRLTVRAIVPLVDAAGKPTAAADPKFAPELPGVTDQESIESWELPFELVEEVRDKDEDYWDEHRTTPKAFVSHALATRLWSTRWGTESVLRIPLPPGERLGEGSATSDDASSPTPAAPGASRGLGSVNAALNIATVLRDALDPAEMGLALLPAKQQALRAASGTTPFDGLFLGFSFFLMASAVMLTALLFRLGIEGRAREVGLLLATGFSPRRLRRLLTGEALAVAAAGAAVGTAAGVAYAALMVHGLNTWWVDATSEPFLELHVTPRSIAIGFAAGLAVAVLTMWWSLRRFARLAPRQLLAGDHQPPLALRSASRWSSAWLPAACLLAAVGLGAAAVRFEGEAQAGAFFGGGALALIGILAAVRGKLREARTNSPTSLSLSGLALRNARRNPSRTMLSLALAATASFLIVALSAFRLAPTERGAGGFDLLATADLPLHYDLNTSEGRKRLGFSSEDDGALAKCTIVSFRVHDGEDASCLNLYQTSQPRVLGAPTKLAEVRKFQWAMVATNMNSPAPSPSEERAGERGEAGTRFNTSPPTPLRRGEGSRGDREASPWFLLNADLGNDANGRPIVPMVLDRNTAFYSLKLYALGDQLTIRDAADQPVTLQIVGMLTNSILQGDVIVSETNFLRLFPEVAGRRFFFIDRKPDGPATAALATLLETQLGDFGFDAVDARERLAALMAVQNTYLSTFQSLGALGLLLGVVGLAVVQLRSVVERRGELALMQAAGFRRRRLVRMVLTENLVLLAGGLVIGCGAALAAVLPHAIVEQVGAPWQTLAILLAVVALAGTIAAWLAARIALRAPLIPALRGE